MLDRCLRKPDRAKLLAALLALGTLAAVVAGSSEIAAKTGALGISVKIADGQTRRIDLYSGYHALVVGCGTYRKGWPSLPNPVKDANEIAAALREMGWEVDLVEDPDAERLVDVLNRLVTGPGQEKEKGVLFWFSGHGETLEEADGTKLGYIVPVDAPDPRRDEAGFVKKAIDMRQLETIAKRIRSKHVLMAFDSCFSGAIFNMVRSSPSPYLLEKIALPVREFVTAGREDERVPDRSVFKTCFLQAVRDRHADRNGDGYVTGEELGSYLQEEVVNYTRKAQHPQFGKINNPKLDKGDFVFIPQSTVASLPSKIDQGREESEALRQQLEVAKKDLEAEKLRQELEQTRKQLEQLKQNQPVAETATVAKPEPQMAAPAVKPPKEQIALPQDSKDPPPAPPIQEQKQSAEASKPPEEPVPSLAEDKSTAGNLLAALPPTMTKSTSKPPPSSPTIFPPPGSSDGQAPYRLAVFPFSLSRGRDFAYYTYTDRFFEEMNRVIDETHLFLPAYSAYDLKNKYGTRLITSALIPKETQDRIWSRSASPELDAELTYRLGKQLGVDAVLTCKVRSETYTPYAAGSQLYTDFRLDKLETFLLDVKSRTKYRADDTNLTASLTKVFKEFEKNHPIVPASSDQAPRVEAGPQTPGSPGGGGSRRKLAILPFYMSGGKDFASYRNNHLLLGPMAGVIEETGSLAPVFSPYDLDPKFRANTLPSAMKENLSKLWVSRGAFQLPEPDAKLLAQLGTKLGADVVMACALFIAPQRTGDPADSLDQLKVVLFDVNSSKQYMQQDAGNYSFWHGSSSKASQAFTSSLQRVFDDYRMDQKQ